MIRNGSEYPSKQHANVEFRLGAQKARQVANPGTTVGSRFGSFN
jgi:hypothetical protein